MMGSMGIIGMMGMMGMSDGSLGDGASVFSQGVAGSGDELRRIHFAVADVQPDGARHEQVVVLAGDGSISTVLLALVGIVLVKTSLVALDIEAFANDLYQGGDDHRLCCHVRVEAILAWCALAYLVLRLTACVEIGIDVGNLIEDILRLVATLHLPFLVVRLQGVALDDQQRVVVVSRNLCGTPCEAVDVAMTVPLRHDRRRFAAVNHAQTVEHHDDRPVRLVGTSAHIDNGKVAVGNLVVRESLRLCPNGKQALAVFAEAEIGQSLLALVGIGIDLTDELGLADERLEALDEVLMHKRLHIVGRELRSHDREIVLTCTLVHIPMYGFKRCTLFP